MTTTTVRRLAHRHHERMPSDSLAVTEWCIETLLSLSHDYDEPDLVTVVRSINPDAPQTIAAELDALYALSDQIAESGRYIVSGDDEWEAPRALIIQEYCDQLGRVARLIRGGQ